MFIAVESMIDISSFDHNLYSICFMYNLVCLTSPLGKAGLVLVKPVQPVS